MGLHIGLHFAHYRLAMGLRLLGHDHRQPVIRLLLLQDLQHHGLDKILLQAGCLRLGMGLVGEP